MKQKMGNLWIIGEIDMNGRKFSQDNCFLKIKNISVVFFSILLMVTVYPKNIYSSFSHRDVFYLSPDEIEILTTKVKQGDMGAAEELALYYEMFEEDSNKAYEFLRIPAKAGVARVQSNLADLLIQSSNIEEQWESISWYKKSAEQGYRESQFNLASLYERGKIVDQDYCQSKYWYEKAARSGEAYSMTKMSKYFEEGKCGDQDIIKAYAWLLVSEKHLHPNSALGKRAIEKMAFFKKQLSESEIKQAKDEYAKLLEEIEAGEQILNGG